MPTQITSKMNNITAILMPGWCIVTRSEVMFLLVNYNDITMISQGEVGVKGNNNLGTKKSLSIIKWFYLLVRPDHSKLTFELLHKFMRTLAHLSGIS
jgi:hypothetical protein